MSETKLFAVAGIVTDGKGRSKVRFGNDLAGRIKILAKSVGATRIDFVDLPSPMGKVDALKYLASHEKFQSPEDQAVIGDNLSNRMPKTAKEPKAPKVAKTKKEAKIKASKQNVPSLDSIKARGKKSKASVEDVIAAVTETVAETAE